MALDDRLDFEKKKISAFTLFKKTCFDCRYWLHKVSNSIDYCHKCINNPKVPIRSKFGYSLETLFDYHNPIQIKNIFLRKTNPINIKNKIEKKIAQ